jgi:hypothetical protein
MKTMTPATIASLTALATMAAALTVNVHAQTTNDSAKERRNATTGGSGGSMGASPAGRSRDEVKAEAVKANIERRSTFSESLDFLTSSETSYVLRMRANKVQPSK